MLVWVCDLIIASEDATFSDPVVAFGVNGVEYFGHPWEFGVRKAKELLLTGGILSAREAQSLGMVNHVVPPRSWKTSPCPWRNASPNARRWGCGWPRNPATRPRTRKASGPRCAPPCRCNSSATPTTRNCSARRSTRAGRISSAATPRRRIRNTLTRHDECLSRAVRQPVVSSIGLTQETSRLVTGRKPRWPKTIR